MKFLYNFFIGILIGSGAILPGISAGVFCVIFGIYEKLIEAITSLFKDFKKNFLFLFPIAFGAFVGIVLFGNIIKYVFCKFENQSKFIFIGLILGTLPSLFKQANLCGNKKALISNEKIGSNFEQKPCSKTNFQTFALKDFCPMVIAFFIGIFLIIAENSFDFDFITSGFANNYMYLFFAGFFMSAGIIIPGVSNTIILMCLGVYSAYIEAVSTINLQILLPIGVGIIIGSIMWLKLIQFFLNKYHKSTFFAIIGFTAGSIFILLPKFELDFSFIIGFILFIFSIILSYKLSKFKH